MSLNTFHPSLNPNIVEFITEFGDELETCNPAAYDLIKKYMETLEIKLLEDFIWYYADELDACQPDAFEILYKIAEEMKIEI